MTSAEPVFTIRESHDGSTFAVRVQPRAKRNAIAGVLGDALKIALTAPPVEGRANEALIAFLAEVLRVPQRSITIAAGQSSRSKVVRIASTTATQIRARLAEHGVT
jgi:uncharacterized protein (TIGR00251 family)